MKCARYTLRGRSRGETKAKPPQGTRRSHHGSGHNTMDRDRTKKRKRTGPGQAERHRQGQDKANRDGRGRDKEKETDRARTSRTTQTRPGQGKPKRAGPGKDRRQNKQDRQQAKPGQRAECTRNPTTERQGEADKATTGNTGGKQAPKGTAESLGERIFALSSICLHRSVQSHLSG